MPCFKRSAKQAFSAFRVARDFGTPALNPCYTSPADRDGGRKGNRDGENIRRHGDECSRLWGAGGTGGHGGAGGITAHIRNFREASESFQSLYELTKSGQTDQLCVSFSSRCIPFPIAVSHNPPAFEAFFVFKSLGASTLTASFDLGFRLCMKELHLTCSLHAGPLRSSFVCWFSSPVI
jgi:hypothetical protein